MVLVGSRGESMNKKGMVVGIMLLFVGTCINSIIAQDLEKSPQPTSMGNWLYVGGSGPGNYTRIQDAIDNASDGDTVFVFGKSSPYNEHLSIDKSITLQGEDKTTTMIDGMSNICADYVVVTDIMFWKWGPAVAITNSSNFIIENCDFNDSGAGIVIKNSMDGVIRNCTFLNETNVIWCLVRISDSDKIEISYCDFLNSVSGFMPSLIDIYHSGGITIHHCTFTRNYGFIIGVHASRGIMIHHCNFTDNYGGGVQIFTSDVQFTSNNFINNSKPGVELVFLWVCDLRDNWWGAPQGPSINFTTLSSIYTVHSAITIRDIKDGDIVNFYGITSIGRFLRLIVLLPRLYPWFSEPVPDAGSHR